MLQAIDIKKKFGDNEVLKGVTVRVARGEVVAIIGRSGSGKSTLLRCMNHLETIDSGEIRIDGQPMVTTGADGVAHVGVMYLGSLVETAPSEEIYTHPLHPYTKALFSAIPKPDPDADWANTRVKLQGEVPSPINTPPGCKFYARCPYAKDICRQKAPELKDVGQGHRVACYEV